MTMEPARPKKVHPNRSRGAKAALLLGAALWMGLPFPAGAATEPFDHVDVNFPEFQYADERTFRGAMVPFGMMMFGPIRGPFNVFGFKMTTLSGAAMWGYDRDIFLVPIAGDPAEALGPAAGTDAKGKGLPPYTLDSASSPGYYHSRFPNGVRVELTATERTGHGRFAFPSGKAAHLMLCPSIWGKNGQVKRIDGTTISGFGMRGKGGHIVYFHGTFNRPLTAFAAFDRSSRSASAPSSGTVTDAGATCADMGFDAAGGPVEMRIGLSYVSEANAKVNLEAEGQPAFDAKREKAREKWSRALERIQVSDSGPASGPDTDKKKRVFYSALYRAMFHPNLINDANGEYPTSASAKKTVPPGQNRYANFSGWDIYRTWIQVVAWLFPRETGDMMQSLVEMNKGGSFPRWPVAYSETGIMEGDPGTAMMASSLALGVTNFDVRRAFGIMAKGSEDRKAKDPLGFAPGSASRSLENYLTEFCAATVAARLGETEKSRLYLERAQNWRKLFPVPKEGVKTMLADGSYTLQKGFTEGNSRTYTWTPSFNVAGIMKQLGGPDAAVDTLDTALTVLTRFKNKWYVDFNNEPSFGIPWMYNWAGKPWKSQAQVQRVLREQFYVHIPGDDDLGAMSSWTIWAMLGLYPSISGIGGFALSTPVFSDTRIQLGNGRVVVLSAPRAAAGDGYIQNATLNGKPYTRSWLPVELLDKPENTLKFTLGSGTGSSWGTAQADRPPSFDTGDALVLPQIPLSVPRPGLGNRKGASSPESFRPFSDALGRLGPAKPAPRMRAGTFLLPEGSR